MASIETADIQKQKEQLPGDNVFNKYIKGPNSTYAYTSDVNNIEMFRLIQNTEDGKEFEFGGYYWTKKDKIIFRKTKEEHDAWIAKHGGGNKTFVPRKKVKDLAILNLKEGGEGQHTMGDVKEYIVSGYELFGNSLSESTLVMPNGKLLIGLVKRE